MHNAVIGLFCKGILQRKSEIHQGCAIVNALPRSSACPVLCGSCSLQSWPQLKAGFVQKAPAIQGSVCLFA